MIGNGYTSYSDGFSMPLPNSLLAAYASVAFLVSSWADWMPFSLLIRMDLLTTLFLPIPKKYSRESFKELDRLFWSSISMVVLRPPELVSTIDKFKFC